MADQPLLSVRNLGVSFLIRGREHCAVEGLSFDLERGQALGIVGESGSGKSVSCSALLGLLPKPASIISGSEAWFNDMNLFEQEERTLRGIRGKAISMVFQDPMTSMNPYMRVGEQVMEPLRIHSRVSVNEARSRAIELLKEVGISDAPERFNQYPHEFSGGMRQRAMIAMAMITEPEILIADEPTSALDVTVQAQILSLLERMREERRLSYVIVSHDLDVIQRISDKVLVMENGIAVESGDTRTVLSNPAHPYTQKLIDAIPHTPKPDSFRFTNSAAPVCLNASDIRVTFPLEGRQLTAVDDVSFQIQQGEVFGIVGESGCGKTTLSHAIVRLISMDSGEVFLHDVPLHTLNRKALLPYRKQVQMVFQDPYASLNPRMTVHDIIAEPLRLHRMTQSDRDTTDSVVNLMESVGLRSEWSNKYPHQFSGGQCQRIAIARALAVRPDLLIADEPVSALDVTIQAQILDLLLDLVSQHNLAMIFISHDLAVVRYMADRVGGHEGW